MDRLGKRLNELEKRQEDIFIQLKRLDEIVTKKVVMRDLTDVKIRIRNLHKNSTRIGSLKCKSTTVPREDIIATEDDYFDPELEELNTTRPVMRMFPKNPLPHSQPLWPRVVRVGNKFMRPQARLSNNLGQFADVEEGENKFGQWKVNRMNSIKVAENSTSRVNIKKEEELISPPFEVLHAEELPAFKPISTDEDMASKDISDLKAFFSLEKISAFVNETHSGEVIKESSDSEAITEIEEEEEVPTKIRFKIDEEMIKKVRSIVVQNTVDDSKPLLKVNTGKHCSVQKASSGTRSATVVERIFSSELNNDMQRELKNKPLTTESVVNMVTVRAKLGSSKLMPSPSKAPAMKSESVRENLRKRLISQIEEGKI